MVQVIKEYIENLNGESVFLLQDLTDEYEGEIITKEEIYFNNAKCVVDDETITLTLDNTENFTIEIDEISDCEVIFDELVILFEDLQRITITA